LNFNNQTRVADHLSISTGNINLVPDKRPIKVDGSIGWYFEFIRRSYK
jgi:hypothetical protein